MIETPEQSVAPAVEQDSPRPDMSLPGGFSIFFIVLGVLALIRIGLGFVSMDGTAAIILNLLLAVIFVGVVIVAEFFSANSRWNIKGAVWFLVGGIFAQIGFAMLSAFSSGVLSGLCNAFAQIGLSTWCVGLGALLGIGLRDKNLLIPVSIFGAAYDFYLVIAPAGLAPGAGLTRNMVQHAPKVFTSIAAQVPSVSPHPITGKAIVGSYVGPADLVFLAAFFIIVFRFKMNPRLTIGLIVPVLILYMLAVLMFRIPLPALVPIGACILIANWKHFNLKRDEWLATGLVALLCAAFLTWGLLRQSKQQEPPTEPSTTANGQATSGSEAMPGPANSNPQKSPSPTAPGNKQGPQ